MSRNKPKVDTKITEVHDSCVIYLQGFDSNTTIDKELNSIPNSFALMYLLLTLFHEAHLVVSVNRLVFHKIPFRNLALSNFFMRSCLDFFHIVYDHSK